MPGKVGRGMGVCLTGGAGDSVVAPFLLFFSFFSDLSFFFEEEADLEGVLLVVAVLDAS